jgi:hypothetical protein
VAFTAPHSGDNSPTHPVSQWARLTSEDLWTKKRKKGRKGGREEGRKERRKKERKDKIKDGKG